MDQHFMVDKGMIRNIISSSHISGVTVLEIGAGKGQLTAPLAKKAGKVIAIEKDKELASLLTKTFRNSNVQVIHGNALKEIKKLRFDIIVSNLPYSICEPLFRLLPFFPFKEAFLTVPKRFFGRLLKLPYSSLLQAEVIFDIPKHAFSPPPRTASVFIRVLPGKDSFLREVLLKRKSKLKNAIKQTLIAREGRTKNQAKESLKTLHLNTMVEKSVIDLHSKDFENLEKTLKRFK